MNYPHVKQNPKITENIEADIVAMKSAIREAEEMLTVRQHPGWIRMSGRMQNDLADVEKELDEFHKLTQDERTIRLTERKNLRRFTLMMEKIEEGLPQMYAALSDLEKQLKERKEKSGA